MAMRHADRSARAGTATSFGNAGGIVTDAVVPNSTPALWHDIPRMLFDRDSAVRMSWRYMPKLTPWLIRFLPAGRRARVEAIADALQPLVSRAYDATLRPRDHAGTRRSPRRAGGGRDPPTRTQLGTTLC
jgi:D-amino-acid dehydrogenase